MLILKQQKKKKKNPKPKPKQPNTNTNQEKHQNPINQSQQQKRGSSPPANTLQQYMRNTVLKAFFWSHRLESSVQLNVPAAIEGKLLLLRVQFYTHRK